MNKPLAQQHYILAIFLFNLFVAALLVLYTLERYDTYRDNQHQLAEKTVISLSNTIDLYIQDLRKRIHLFTEQKQNLITQLADPPLDEATYTQLNNKITLHFPEHLSWIIATHDGTPLLENFGHLVDRDCRQDLKNFVENIRRNCVYIHSSSQEKRFHFDIMIPLKETQRVFLLALI